MRRAVFLDRDGVINKKLENDYVTDWSKFEFLPTVKEAIRLLNQANILVIIITNQSVIGRELISEDKLHKIHSLMEEELAKSGAKVDKIYYCPHAPWHNCNCRKPKPGLLEKALKDFKIDIATSWMIGDEEKDIKAGQAVGLNTYLINKHETLLEVIKKII